MNNIKPRTREEREAMKDKEIIEKSRINQRNGLETRKVDVKDLLHNSHPSSTLFANENDRFDKDFAVNDKKKRLEDEQKKQIALEQHRLAQLERDAKRWEQMESEDQKAIARNEYKKAVFSTGKRNHNGLPFNPITLEYHSDDKGQMLMQKDEESKVRGYLRATNLDARSNCGYDLLTGEPRREVVIPEDLNIKYEEKITNAYENCNIKNYKTASNRK